MRANRQISNFSAYEEEVDDDFLRKSATKFAFLKKGTGLGTNFLSNLPMTA